MLNRNSFSFASIKLQEAIKHEIYRSGHDLRGLQEQSRNEEHITDVVNYMKKLLSGDNTEEEELAKSRAEFQELLKIREEYGKMNLGTIDEIRSEAIAKKYGIM